MKIVTAGIIRFNNKILIAQRIRTKKPALLWEFPGGKVENGETLQACLKREIKEEFGLDIEVGEFLMTSSYDYEFGSFQLEVFFAEAANNNIGILNSHEDYRWVSISDLDNFEFSPADIPVVEKLKSLETKL